MQTNDLDIAGTTTPVSYTERGAGHPFLILHGGGGPQTVTGFADLLAAQRHAHVITPTHPGFGVHAKPKRGAKRSGWPACNSFVVGVAN